MAEPLPILHTGRNYVAVAKPAGITVEAYQDHDTVEARAWGQFRRPRSPKRPFVGIVHRLDRPVSGVLLLARNKSTLRELNRIFASGQVTKSYLARTRVPLPGQEGRLTDWLVKDNLARRARVGSRGVEGAKSSELTYKLLGHDEGGFTYEIQPITGRYHQIRVQLAAAGAPIVGDDKYGSTTPYLDNQIMLHARSLSFPEAGGVTVTVECAPPWGK